MRKGKVFYNNQGRQEGTGEIIKKRSFKVPYYPNPFTEQMQGPFVENNYQKDGGAKGVTVFNSSGFATTIPINFSVEFQCKKILFFTHSTIPNKLLSVVHDDSKKIKCTVDSDDYLVFAFYGNKIYLNTKTQSMKDSVIDIYYI